MGTEIVPLLLHQLQAAREEAVLAAFRQAGACSPATAVPRTQLPPLDEAVLETLIVRGRVREGAPGTFYEYVAPQADRRTRATRVVLFSVVVVAIPALFLWLTARR